MSGAPQAGEHKQLAAHGEIISAIEDLSGTKLSQGQAVQWLRDHGAGDLANRLRTAARARNAGAHPDVRLRQDILKFLDIQTNSDRSIAGEADAVPAWSPTGLADDRVLRRRTASLSQESAQVVEPPIEAAPQGGGSAETETRSLSDEQARLQNQELHQRLKGRFEYEDFKFTDILRESRRDNLEVHERIDGVEKHATTIHIDVLEALHCEQRAADSHYRSATEELRRLHAETKHGVEDMAGCIQDKVENRLSELHSVVHTQIEEVHERVDATDRLISEGAAHRDAAASRVAQLGVVVSSCLASIWVASSRVDKLDTTWNELHARCLQGAEIVRALQARDGSRSHATDEKTSNT